MITIWHRIELDTADDRADALERTISTPVYDPLWLLARQRQLGEWQGSDGGSIVDAHVAIEVDPVLTVSSNGRSQDVRDLPLEPFVEAERTPPGMRTRVRAGLHFVIALVDANLEYRDALVAAFPAAADDDDAVYAALANAPDGLAVFAAIQAGTLATTIGVRTLDTEPFARVADAFARWFALQAGLAIDTWDPERLEHRFEIQTARHTFAASEYFGGRLDWHAFDLVREQGTTAAIEQTVLPLPIEISGMPVARYWELEDPTSEPGALEIGPGEAARALLLDFALRFASDWSVVPLVTRAGAVTRVQRTIVVDTFGVPIELRASTDVRPDQNWRLWSTGDSAGMLLPFAIDAIDGPPIEELALTRDEQANLVWAIERVVPGALDRGVTIRELPPLPPTVIDAQLRYRPLPELPIAHVPFLKRVVENVTWLVRGRSPAGVLAWEPRGALIPFTPRLRDVDLPSEGLLVVRRAQLARTATGATIVWCGRARAPGIDTPATRVAFDDLLLG